MLRSGLRTGGCWLVLALVAGGLAPASAAGGPGRIAVGGVYPVGYVGCLARYGLPREMLLEDQLGDPATLARYDLVIVAGVADRTVLEALRLYALAGGRVLFDYSSDLGRAPGGGTLTTPGGLFGYTASGTYPLRALGAGNPLTAALAELVDDPQAGGGRGRRGYAPDPTALVDPQILAEFSGSGSAGGVRGGGGGGGGGRPGRGGGGGGFRPGPVQAGGGTFSVGPPVPAIVLGGLGQGRVMLCGVNIGVGAEVNGVNFDPLILALVKELSGGRAVPQLQPEGPRLGRKESPRTVGHGDGAEEPEAADASRPHGPGARGPLPTGFTLLDDEQADEFNVSASVPAKPGDLLLHAWNATNALLVTVGPGGVKVTRRALGHNTTLASAPGPLPVGARVAVKERYDSLLIEAGDAFLTVDVAGLHGGALGARGLAATYDRREAVYFADDFMRTNDQESPWQTLGGVWSTTPVENPDMGANPFSYKVEAGNGAAAALAGLPLWDEYSFTAAVRPGAAGGQLGLGWYAQDAANMYALSADVRAPGGANLGGANPGGLRLLKIVAGQPQVLAAVPGSLAPEQWYKLTVKTVGPWLGVFLDGAKILGARDTTFAGGQVALLVDHTGARFDDVVVASAVLPAKRGQSLGGEVPDFAGLIDVDTWAGPATAWEPAPDTSGLFWRRNAFFGDLEVRFEQAQLADGASVALGVDGDGVKADSGYWVSLKRTGARGELELRRDATLVAKRNVLLDGRTSLAVQRTVKERGEGRERGAASLRVMLGDKLLVAYPVQVGGGGGRLGFRSTGFVPKVSSLSVWSSNLRDYTFDGAPVDWWVGSGTWDVTNRWSCTPDWSWFGGYSQSVASIWNKQSFAGDVGLDFYVGPKMAERDNPGWDAVNGSERIGDFNAVLCGNGRDINHGYAFVVGHETVVPSDGGPYRTVRETVGQTAQLLRDGQVVANNPRFRFYSRGHNRWANVRAERRGHTLCLSVDGQPVVTWTDPHPLPGGFVGIWTQNNGIMVPRVTIGYEQAANASLSRRN